MSSSSQAPESWISAFCSLVGHEYFAEVSEDFIEDDFNLTGLQSQVPMYKEALEMILDVEPEDASEEEEDEEEDEDEDEDEMQDGAEGLGRPGYRRAADAAAAAAERRHLRMASDLSMIESSAEMLYGLIHQRFITSRPGIQQMAEKYELGHFGHCPRVHCHGAKVLPVGCSDIPGQETVKLFCPSCLDVYSPPNSRFQTVDGAFFGTTFGCLFFMTFPDLDVGGSKPAPSLETSTSSPLAGSAAMAQSSMLTDKPSRSSLSSSLASQQPGLPPPPINAPLPKQPESINGVAPKNLAPGLGATSLYEPRIYGFRVAEIAKNGPRMKWLRSRPMDVNELDECKAWALNQEALAEALLKSTTDNDMADADMVDENEEIDDGEAEDQDMEAGADQMRSNGKQAKDVPQRKKAAPGTAPRRKPDPQDAALNGDAVRV
ncbi:related to casein kinase II, beta subunit [Ramularia collo-cygni]|uniref:Casein kinase II subunit beta n=1 Tax=Ramularia collo-cygni TaxID=112498 RepID=A0A2D3VKG6_9PEZI|nr:related to casein kinase II, beta subunit [Ramularia collo-cygni]CZT22854.1 related to casein kinase II, beta subunit [Ramularia collo-cygni]